MRLGQFWRGGVQVNQAAMILLASLLAAVLATQDLSRMQNLVLHFASPCLSFCFLWLLRESSSFRAATFNPL